MDLKQSSEKMEKVPLYWKRSCVNTECSLHQLSPYIGKLKSTIASYLISRYSSLGDLVVDPFAGSGTIPLEAVLHERRTFCADINPYAKILCQAKLKAPPSCDSALEQTEKVLDIAKKLPAPDLRKVPAWVRQFFHPWTLKDAIRFASVCRKNGEDFLFACFLGILHHQRPGFLSYPSSHLVPYLRTTKYPRNEYPEMYGYRELGPRLFAKVRRAYARCPAPPPNDISAFRLCSVQTLEMPRSFDCLISSPPYMNALDYNRDNRLRLWFVDPIYAIQENRLTKQKAAFIAAMASLAKKINSSLKSGGFCILILGEQVARNPKVMLSFIVREIMKSYAPTLKLQTVLKDDIPDVRRSRRNFRGTKKEHFLIYQKA